MLFFFFQKLKGCVIMSLKFYMQLDSTENITFSRSLKFTHRKSTMDAHLHIHIHTHTHSTVCMKTWNFHKIYKINILKHELILMLKLHIFYFLVYFSILLFSGNSLKYFLNGILCFLNWY